VRDRPASCRAHLLDLRHLVGASCRSMKESLAASQRVDGPTFRAVSGLTFTDIDSAIGSRTRLPVMDPVVVT
jgi:hypothetical protein